MLSHCASAALAMACAMAKRNVLLRTTPCAPAGDDSAAATAKLAKAFDNGDMS